MPVRLSYTNARGQEIILDDDRHSFLGEIMGREGFDAPAIDLKTVKLGNGNEDVISVSYKKREMTCYFWAETPDRAAFLRKFHSIKAGLVQVGKKPDNWGFLKILRPDGTYARINCVYSEGLESMMYDSAVRTQFSLTFVAADPLFYDQVPEVITLSTYRETDYLHFGSGFHFGNETFFRSSGYATNRNVRISCARAYPVIRVTGPADNIRLYNQSTGRVIEFDPSFRLLAGEYAEIVTKPLECSAVWHRYDGTEVNALRYLSPDTVLDWFLENGENQLIYRNSNNNPESVCTLSYQAGWLSV